MADLGNRGAVDALINSILYDLAPNDSIQPSDHNGMLADILDTLANGLYTTLRTNNETGGIDIIITDGDGVQFGSGAFAGRIIPATLTGNNIYTLPDATGTIALTSDIDNIYNTDGTLTANRTVDMNGNELTLDNGVLKLANTGASSLMVFDPNSDVSTLSPGTTITAGQITNRQLGHLVVDIIANDNDDSFAIRSNKNNLGPNPVDTILKIVSTDGYETNFLNTTVIADARLKNNHFSFYNNSGSLGLKYKNNTGTVTPLSIGDNISNANLTFDDNHYVLLPSARSWTVGGTAPVGTEKIALLLNTSVRGSNTSSGTSGFTIYDSSNVSLWQFRNNGDIIRGTGGGTLGAMNIGSTNTNASILTSYTFGYSNTVNGTQFGRCLIGDFNTSNSQFNNYQFGRYHVSNNPYTLNLGFWTQSNADGAMAIGIGDPANSAVKMVNSTPYSLGLGWNSTTPQHLFYQTGAILGGQINMAGLPTSSVGLVAGDLWNDAGTLKIV